MGTLKVFDGSEYKPAGVTIIAVPLEKVYPVGAIYLSTVATNPADLFGFGEWEQIKDTFLLAAGDTYAAGATGGEAEVTLTVDEMPSHGNHLYTKYTTVGTGIGKYLGSSNMSSYNNYGRGWDDWNGAEYYPAGQSLGGDQPHNNMPPYLAVYAWQRVS